MVNPMQLHHAVYKIPDQIRSIIQNGPGKQLKKSLSTDYQHESYL